MEGGVIAPLSHPVGDLNIVTVPKSEKEVQVQLLSPLIMGFYISMVANVTHYQKSQWFQSPKSISVNHLCRLLVDICLKIDQFLEYVLHHFTSISI